MNRHITRARNLLLCAILAGTSLSLLATDNPKREFRGAWLHVVGPVNYRRMSTEQAKSYIISQLDKLAAAGCNAVIFQVRPMADALYESSLEPWSGYLTGKRGKAPSPAWDPMEFALEEAHKRGMEFHAWLNPYRVTAPGEALPADHLSKKEPHRFFRHNNQVFFDPAYPENRQFIANVVKDIISRYDVDAIHMDDYFYPYPSSAGAKFNNDDASYAKFGKGQDRGDWRRHNVDLLIEQVHETIQDTKPWVRFGVSPFGIWRNKKSDPRGSDTNGLQNYDALYADVLLWSKNGWVDYVIPQLYWELEHKAASYLTLNQWWNDNAYDRHMYIGQAVEKTMQKPDLAPSTEKSQLRHKIELTREAPNIQGTCWFPGYSITKNVGGIADSLARDLQNEIALVPAYPWISTAKPAAVSGLASQNGKMTWNAPAPTGSSNDVVRFVVYRLADNSRDLRYATIVAVTPEKSFAVKTPGTYVITALNRVNNESEPSSAVKIKK